MSSRETILRAAATLLSRNNGATMDEVAKAAGISRATLHRYFAGRKTLIKALEELGIAETERAFQAARLDEGTATEALHRVVAETESTAPLLSFLLSEDQLYLEEPSEGWQQLEDRLAALFHRGQADGEFRIDMSTTWLSDALLALIAAAAWSAQFGRIASKDYRAMVLDLFLNGARREQP
ncbi:TetR/AcrR family transcriptional regulator [Sciscionella sediminilitoris]|uniref:TetR/AcrR family transcriptional regulator n=1 Tax=Sciscionella sediminilitoris TaxID=1445613 RepID=UPI0004DF9EA0|nr:TetR/AcrR family transcriptional regulator [Sciscionella sp. SE31]